MSKGGYPSKGRSTSKLLRSTTSKPNLTVTLPGVHRMQRCVDNGTSSRNQQASLRWVDLRIKAQATIRRRLRSRLNRTRPNRQ